jgi:hypothetical protein
MTYPPRGVDLDAAQEPDASSTRSTGNMEVLTMSHRIRPFAMQLAFFALVAAATLLLAACPKGNGY